MDIYGGLLKQNFYYRGYFQCLREDLSHDHVLPHANDVRDPALCFGTGEEWCHLHIPTGMGSAGSFQCQYIYR